MVHGCRNGGLASPPPAPPLSTTTHAACPPTTMSASTHSSATDVDVSDSETPRIEALFLIRFDKKVGYVLRRISMNSTADSSQLHNRMEAHNMRHTP